MSRECCSCGYDICLILLCTYAIITHDSRAASAADVVVKSPGPNRRPMLEQCSCNPCDTSTAIAVFEMPYHHPCATTHVHTKATSRTTPHHHHTCTICQRKVPMAVTAVKQRPRPDSRCTESSRSRCFQRPLSASEWSLAMSQAFKRQGSRKSEVAEQQRKA